MPLLRCLKTFATRRRAPSVEARQATRPSASAHWGLFSASPVFGLDAALRFELLNKSYQYLLRAKPMSAKTIAIATHKGGTGKTVTAMALGAGLARAGKKTLLVDLDPQGHCSLGLGVECVDGGPSSSGKPSSADTNWSPSKKSPPRKQLNHKRWARSSSKVSWIVRSIFGRGRLTKFFGSVLGVRRQLAFSNSRLYNAYIG
jgi:hypothetical protein